jgi:hypothetical protein
MKIAEFWDQIAKTKRKDPEAHAKQLVARLAKLSVEEILSFSHWWDTMKRKAYSWKLWGAAYIIEGGCSDDGFDYFRGWLILKGKDVFAKAIKSPDSLATIVSTADFCEYEGNPAWDAWFIATKKKKTEKAYDELLAAEAAQNGKPETMPELGEGWDFDDGKQMKKRYPKLCELFHDFEDD